MCRLELSLQILACFFATEKQVSLNALEVTVDVFHRRDAFNAMDRRHVTLGGNACALFAVEAGDVVVPIVECGGEMGGGAARLSATDWPVVDDDYGAAGAGEEISGGHSGDAGADYTDIGAEVLSKWLELWHFGRAHPDRGRVTRVAMHAESL